jgi:hypothetical protein
MSCLQQFEQFNARLSKVVHSLKLRAAWPHKRHNGRFHIHSPEAILKALSTPRINTYGGDHSLRTGNGRPPSSLTWRDTA